MAVKRDYYEVLGIDKNADDSAIKKAYRKLAKKYHPDTNSGNSQAEQKFKEITEAYSILSDPEKRKLYDRFGHAAFDGTGAERSEASGGFGDFQNTGGYQSWHFEGGDAQDFFGDIFDDLFHNYGNQYSNGEHSYYGHGFGRGGFTAKGQDAHAEISVSFDDAAFGAEKIIQLNDGKNGIQSLQVHIPAGIDDGRSIRLRGKGMPGVNGGENGDLLIKVNVGTRPDFERKGMDVYSTIQIPYTTAVFGGETIIQTLKGQVRCNIRPGTQSGTKIRLKGKGIVSMNDPKVYGDQYAIVQIEVPKYLTKEAQQKLKEFEAACAKSGFGAA